MVATQNAYITVLAVLGVMFAHQFADSAKSGGLSIVLCGLAGGKLYSWFGEAHPKICEKEGGAGNGYDDIPEDRELIEKDEQYPAEETGAAGECDEKDEIYFAAMVQLGPSMKRGRPRVSGSSGISRPYLLEREIVAYVPSSSSSTFNSREGFIQYI
jgi:hypothetical protein